MAKRKPAKKSASRAVRKPAKAAAAARPARKVSGARKAVVARPAARKVAAKPVRAAVVSAPPVSRAPTTPASSGLSPKDIAHFRELLLDKRRQLLGDVGGLQDEALSKESSGDLSNMPLHMADVGTDNYEQEFTLGLIQGERQLLGEIDEALQRIARKTYGICAATGNPIGKARLSATPWAKYCYEYMLEQERRQGRRY